MDIFLKKSKFSLLLLLNHKKFNFYFVTCSQIYDFNL